MEDNLKNTDAKLDDEPKPKRKKRLVIPWKILALYILPALIVFIIFFIMHNSFVGAPLSREEIEDLLNNNQKVEVLAGVSEEDSVEDKDQGLPQNSNIPFIGPQHFYHPFTGALATDLKNGSGILTIEIAVSIFMGKLNAEAYFESFKTFEPALRSAILALMRTKTKTQLETNEGKEVLS